MKKRQSKKIIRSLFRPKHGKNALSGFLYLLVMVTLAILISRGCIVEIPPKSPEPIPKPSPQSQTQQVAEFREDTIDPGIFTFDRIVDGDTIHIVETNKSLRLLCVDAEETFKPNQSSQKELAQKDWTEYLKLKYKRKTPRPVKYPTPVGDIAAQYADSFFDGVEKVKIERDSIDRVRDLFERPLVYVLVEKDGKWVNYNVELVRNGLSPYYMKYGWSERYHDDFLKAEDEARKAKKGIWNPEARHYPDYPQRIAWWKDRADEIKAFEDKFGDNENYIFVQNDTDWERLKDLKSKEITIFGTIDRIRSRTKPYLAYVTHKEGRSVIIRTDKEELIDLIKEKYEEELYLYFTGKLEFTDGDYLMKFDSISQIKFDEKPEKR